MTNLLVSTVCNQQCDYCFTADYLAGSNRPGGFLSLDAFDDRLDFLDRSAIGQVRLMGGEPTLHPQFAGLIARAVARNKHIVVFTNGLMPDSALSCLERLESAACTVLINVNEPARADSAAFARRRTTLARLGDRAMPGFNICRTGFDPAFLLPLIAETGCRPAIRFGMAHPCLSGANRYIHPAQYVALGRRIVELARDAARCGISLEFDCGFVRCMFSDDDLRTLSECGVDVGWRCNPILDVDVDSNVLHCYPLARLGTLPLSPETDAESLRRAFAAMTHGYRQAGVFPECSTCSFKVAGDCAGGCLAATIRRFRHTPFALEVPIEEALA